jgi:hypothetical protein
MKFFNFRFAKLGIVIAGVAAAGGAQAVQYASYAGGYNDAYSAAVQNSTVVTEREVATIASLAQADMVLSEISGRLDSHVTPSGSSFSLLPQKGANAGASDQRNSIWARAGIDNMRENNISTLGGWNANLWSLAIGYDYKFNDKFLAGLALTYSNLNGTTKYNNGKMRDNAYGLVPYVAFHVMPCFDIEAMVGYSRVNKSRTRGTSASTTDLTLSGAKATSSPKSNRWFGALYGNYRHHIQKWNLLARLGYLYATDRQKSYTEGGASTRPYAGLTNSLNRVSLRLQAGYKASHTVEPYAFLTYARDFGATKMNFSAASANLVDPTYVDPNTRRSNNTFGGGLGLNAHLGCSWTTSLEANYAQSKKFRNIGGMVRVAKKF